MSEYVCPHPEHHTDLNMYCELVAKTLEGEAA